MKRLALLLFLPLIFACGGTSSENSESRNILENLTFTVDTLVMDPGNKLVNLRFAPSLFDLSPDQSLYYFMHRTSGDLSVFDLEEKKLIKQIRFEKEGPNAIPNFVSSFQMFDENRFLITGYRNISFFDSSRVKLMSIPFSKEIFDGLTEEEGFSLITGFKANDQQEIFVSLPNDPKTGRVSLAVWENRTLQARLIDLPEFGFLTKFTLEFREGDTYSGASFASFNLKMEKDRALAFSSGTTSIYSYDLVTDSIVFKTYTPKLMASQAEVPAVSEFSSRPAFDEATLLARSQISFGGLLWDDNRRIYLRFASITKQSPDPELPSKSEVFLLAFDKKLNLVGETKMEELPSQPSWPFFKDGKLWSYVNVEDELGFAVMDFKF